jgi:hypothetical protein
MMSGIDVYGLRRAKKICRDLMTLVKGENDPYARGYRAALKTAAATIDAAIKEGPSDDRARIPERKARVAPSQQND